MSGAVAAAIMVTVYESALLAAGLGGSAVLNRGGGSKTPSVKINTGQQNKHIVGTNNYIPGRSVLTADPNNL